MYYPLPQSKIAMLVKAMPVSSLLEEIRNVDNAYVSGHTSNYDTTKIIYIRSTVSKDIVIYLEDRVPESANKHMEDVIKYPHIYKWYSSIKQIVNYPKDII